VKRWIVGVFGVIAVAGYFVALVPAGASAPPTVSTPVATISPPVSSVTVSTASTSVIAPVAITSVTTPAGITPIVTTGVTTPAVTDPVTATEAPAVAVTVPGTTVAATPAASSPTSSAPTSPAPGTVSLPTTGSGKDASQRADGPDPGTRGNRTGPASPATVSVATGPPGVGVPGLHGVAFADSTAQERSLTGAAKPLLAPVAGRLVALSPGVVLRNLGIQRVQARGRFAVLLSFVLSAPTRVTFLVFGPGQACSLAGWITIGGHRGVNHVLFRGRVQKHQLQPGAYRLVPRAGSPGLASLPTIGVVADRHGVRPATSAAPLDCVGPVAPDMRSALTPKARAGLAGVSRLEPPVRFRPASAASAQPVERRSRGATVLPVLEGRTRLGVFLLTLLGLSALSLTVAAIRPSYALARYRPVRELVNHRPQIGLLGFGLLLAATALFLVDRLST
jgi:hypothetical protein